MKTALPPRHRFYWLATLLIHLAVGSVMFINTSLQAQQFDQSYLKWKSQQLDQDRRLGVNKGSMAMPLNQAAQISNEKVSLNRASAEQLQQALSGVGEKKAQAIVEYRNKNGKFSSIEDLQRVKGIGPKLFEKNKARLAL